MSTSEKFAVICRGGKQYKVREQEELLLDHHLGEVGEQMVFEEIALIRDTSLEVGTPLVPGARAIGEILAHEKAARVISFKQRRRQNSRRRRGHRQAQTRVKIIHIIGAGDHGP